MQSTINRRQAFLSGDWQVIVTQHEGPDGKPIEVRGNATIRANDQIIEGQAGIMTFEHQGQTRTLRLTYECGSLDDNNCLTIRYQAENTPMQIQYGFIIVQLSLDGEKLEGGFAGLGILSEKVVYGKIELRRDSSTDLEAAQPTEPNSSISAQPTLPNYWTYNN